MTILTKIIDALGRWLNEPWRENEMAPCRECGTTERACPYCK